MVPSLLFFSEKQVYSVEIKKVPSREKRQEESLCTDGGFARL